MLRNTLKAGLAVFALAMPARSLAADTVYYCTPDEPRVAAPDRLVSVAIRLQPNGAFVSVVYRAANGTVIDRSAQYQSINGQEKNFRYWVGRLRNNPNVGIMGSFQRHGDRLYYYETIHDNLQGGKVVSQVTSLCDGGRLDHSEAATRTDIDNSAPRRLPQPSNESGSRVVAPIEEDGGTFLVPVIINGTMKLNFMIDSGASDVVIPADVFKTLLRSGTVDESDVIGKKRYQLADGSENSTISFRLKSVRVGSVTLSNVPASVTPAAGNPLLGQSFLGRFRSWSLDNQRGLLILN